jgi:hypothetical protein
MLYIIDNCIEVIDSYLKENSIEVGVYSYSEYKKVKKIKPPIDKTEFGFTTKRRESQLHQRKSVRPPYEQLLLEVNEMGYVATGKKYGVSDNTIRKWIRMYKKYGENF